MSLDPDGPRSPARRRAGRWYLHRTVLFVGALSIAGAAWSAYASAGARRKLDPALRPALEARQPVNIWVELPFPPEEFHIRYLQERGTVTGVRGRLIHLVRVPPGAAWAIARLYWVARIWGEPGPQGQRPPEREVAGLQTPQAQRRAGMPFHRFDALPQETISPHYSTAAGGTVTGDVIEVGKYSMARGTGADPHHHPNEQIIYVLRGKLRVRIENEERVLDPGDVAHFPSNAVHEVRALEDSEFLSSKNLVDGKGSRGWSAAAPVQERTAR